MNVHLRMLGCRLNQAEIDAMARQLVALGHTLQAVPEQADWLVVNTCAVTKEAERKSRRLVRELARRAPHGEVLVTGCYAQLAATEGGQLPGNLRLFDNQQKETLVSTVTGVPPEDMEPIQRDLLAGFSSRSRAFVKVQDGCDHECTFCITTILRGPSRSRAAGEIVAEVQTLHEAGFREVVLTGVQLGSYGKDLATGMNLAHLVRFILRETDIERLRLSSLEPWDLTEDFFTLWENRRLCRHLHLPLQSGCDATLRRMRRRTSTREYEALLNQARRQIPGIHISSDIIVGFPGETAAEYASSEAFIRDCEFASLHIFRYSPREGTPASRMKGQIAAGISRERSARMHALAAQGRARFVNRNIGETTPVLWEQIVGATQQGYVHWGYTENYIPVYGAFPEDLRQTITPALITGYDAARDRACAVPLSQLEPAPPAGKIPA